MKAPTIEDLNDATGGRYTVLVRRKIGGRYVLVHFNRNAFVFGIGVEACKFGWLWFIGPISFCIALPANVS